MASGLRRGLIWMFAAAAVVSVPVVALAQSADAVLCDRVAADPNDLEKPADVKGVANIP